MNLLFFFVGSLSLIAQVVLFRELAVVFLGHEITLGLALASWLLWGGLGSFRADRAGPSRDALSFYIGWLALAAPLTVILVRLARLAIPFGHLPGLAFTIGASLVLLVLPCWPIGAAFRAGAALARQTDPHGPTRLYLFESLGAFLGGLLMTGVLLGRVSGLVLLTLAGALLVLIAWICLRPRRSVLTMTLPAVALGLLACARPLDTWSRTVEFRGYHLTAQRETRYEHLALARLGRLYVLMQNGVVSAQFPDPETQEEFVHWPLLAHGSPEQFLALGVAALPCVPEILEHPVKALDVVDADAEAMQFLRPVLPPESTPVSGNERVRWHAEDPRVWIDTHAAAYDVILHTIPEPLNASLNRLFTREFFLSAKRSLRPGGILALSILSSANYLPPEVAFMNATVIHALKEVFPHTAMIAGSRVVLLASDAPLDITPDLLARRYQERAIRNEVIEPLNFPYQLSPSRRESTELQMRRAVPTAQANTDMNPVSYFHTWRVWLSMFVAPTHFVGLTVAVLVLGIAVSRLWRLRNLRGLTRESVLILAAGFGSMGGEVVLLVAFQAMSGAVYWQLGALLGSFMAGLSLGCGLLVVWGDQIRSPRAALAGAILLLALLFLGLPVILSEWAAGFHGHRLLVFSALLAADGLLVGIAFPLALACPGQSPGVIYAADLWGASLGAFVTGAFLIPLCGMPQTLVLCGLLLIASLAVAIPWFRSSRGSIRAGCGDVPR